MAQRDLLLRELSGVRDLVESGERESEALRGQTEAAARERDALVRRVAELEEALKGRGRAGEAPGSQEPGGARARGTGPGRADGARDGRKEAGGGGSGRATGGGVGTDIGVGSEGELQVLRNSLSQVQQETRAMESEMLQQRTQMEGMHALLRELTRAQGPGAVTPAASGRAVPPPLSSPRGGARRDVGVGVEPGELRDTAESEAVKAEMQGLRDGDAAWRCKVEHLEQQLAASDQVCCGAVSCPFQLLQWRPASSYDSESP